VILALELVVVLAVLYNFVLAEIFEVILAKLDAEHLEACGHHAEREEQDPEAKETGVIPGGPRTGGGGYQI
jgi:hypothetical protein